MSQIVGKPIPTPDEISAPFFDGVTPMGKIYGRRSVDFAAEAIALALDDAGLAKTDVDGLLINAPNPRTLRFMPALNVSNAEIDRMIESLDHILATLTVEPKSKQTV